MQTQIFVNLPVKDLSRSRKFFETLGFGFNQQFSNENVGCLVISDSIYVMLQTFDNFRQFIKREVGDPSKTTQTIIAISAETKAKVDALFQHALEGGGKKANDVKDFGFMYGKSFEDPDGYIWEVLWFDQSAVK